MFIDDSKREVQTQARVHRVLWMLLCYSITWAGRKTLSFNLVPKLGIYITTYQYGFHEKFYNLLLS